VKMTQSDPAAARATEALMGSAVPEAWQSSPVALATTSNDPGLVCFKA